MGAKSRAVVTVAWILGSAIGWLLVVFLITTTYSLVTYGPFRPVGPVLPAWDMTALELPATLTVAGIEMLAGALFAVLLRAQGAPSFVWLAVLIGPLAYVGIGLNEVAPGLWPLTLVAVQWGAPLVTGTLGAFVGSWFFDRRLRSRVESDTSTA